MCELLQTPHLKLVADPHKPRVLRQHHYPFSGLHIFELRILIFEAAEEVTFLVQSSNNKVIRGIINDA